MPTAVSAPEILCYWFWAPVCTIKTQSICLHSQPSSISNSSIKDYRLTRPFFPNQESLFPPKAQEQNCHFLWQTRAYRRAIKTWKGNLCVCIAEVGTDMLKETDTSAVPFNQITQDTRSHCCKGREDKVSYLTYSPCTISQPQRRGLTVF